MQTGVVIKALGGPTAIAKMLGLSVPAVGNWTMRDEIPREHHLALWRLAMAKNVAWTPPDAVGLVLVPEAEQPPPERELVAAFRSIDEQGREMILRLVRSLRSDARVQREAAE